MNPSLTEIFSLPQLFGWVAFVLYIVSYQILSPRRTVLTWGIANGFYAAHWFLIGAFPAMMIAIGACIRDTTSAFAPEKTVRIVLLLFVIYAWVSTIIMAEAPYDYLAAIGTTFLTIASYYGSQKRFYYQRNFSYGHQLSWLAYSFYTLSYPGIAQNILALGSNTVGIWRYWRKSGLGRG